MKWDAEQYDTAKAPQIDAGRELIGLAGVRKQDRVLDLGCGTGKLTVELARLAHEGRVTGIDPSPEMLDKARVASDGLQNLRLQQTLAQDMAFDGEFDLLFSSSALHWVKEQPAVARLMLRSLRKGGRIAVQMPTKGFCPDFFESVDGAISSLGYERFFERWRTPWHFPAQEEYERVLAEAGFQSVDVRRRDYHLLFDTVADVVHWWSSAGLRPYLAALPETGQGHFLEAFGECFGKKRTDRGIEFAFRRIFAFARKSS